jgi:hypothetical protein
MKKFFAFLAISAALVACGKTETSEAAADTTAVVVETPAAADTTTIAVDSAAVGGDTTKVVK